MDSYCDITILVDPEFKTTVLMSMAVGKLHDALVALGADNIGVSFPAAEREPGAILRLHGDEVALKALLARQAWAGMADFLGLGDIQAVPSVVQYINVRRVQPKLTAARLRRAVKRNSLTVDQAETMLESRDNLKQPFFRLTSSSTGQKFPLFIHQSKPISESSKGTFNTYGLSRSATVPWF